MAQEETIEKDKEKQIKMREKERERNKYFFVWILVRFIMCSRPLSGEDERNRKNNDKQR